MQALELPNGLYKRLDGRWCKLCPNCGEEQDYLRRNYAIQSFLLGKECKKCSNRKTENSHRGFVGSIRSSWLNKCKVGAETRGIHWELVAQDIADLYDKQEGVCALSGLPIGWVEVGQNHTASIDRIDSKKGYTKGNIQLVHKNINMMKQSFSQEQFIALCNAVSDKVKW